MRLLPWPKFSCVVRNGASFVSMGLSNVTVMCTGPVDAGSGDQPFSLRVSRTNSGRYASSQESAVTWDAPIRRLRFTWSPGTDSALALKAVRTNVGFGCGAGDGAPAR